MTLRVVGAGVSRTGTVSLKVAIERLLGERCYPPAASYPAWGRMVRALMAAFTPDYLDEEAAKAAYLAHNESVRRAVSADRLVEWSPGDGWEPICAALGVDVPAEPFPHANTTDDFRVRNRLDRT